MGSNDRILVAIVVGVVLLAAVAFGLAMRRPAETYRPDGPPEAAVHNYLLALRQHDYARAYGYLAADLPGRPKSVEQFQRDVSDNEWQFGPLRGYVNPEAPSTLKVEGARITGDAADVLVIETSFREGGLFNSTDVTNPFHMRLRRVGADWRLVAGDSYWLGCWDQTWQCPPGDPRYRLPATPFPVKQP